MYVIIEGKESCAGRLQEPSLITRCLRDHNNTEYALLVANISDHYLCTHIARSNTSGCLLMLRLTMICPKLEHALMYLPASKFEHNVV